MKQYQIVNEASRPNKPKTIEDIDPTVVIDVSQNDHDEPMAAKDFENNKRIRNKYQKREFSESGELLMPGSSSMQRKYGNYGHLCEFCCLQATETTKAKTEK